MNIDDLTIGQAKELVKLFSTNTFQGEQSPITSGVDGMIGEKVIVRTYSAGVWFGLLKEKSKNEVILSDARRMYKWWAKESISLSAVAIHGIKREKSQICEPVDSVWLESIEIISCTNDSVESIEGAENVEAE
jgi:hypothetical protein